MANKNLILETKHLTKKFNKQIAVNDLSLHIPYNSVFGLLGPNGAGKSTLLKLVTGLLKQDEGEILYCGHKWSREDLGTIGSLIESPPLYENLSAVDNLKVKTLMLDIPESRIKEVLEIVRLDNTGKKKAGQFSMGMKQRLGIALALLNSPKLLILDEPSNGLDPIAIQELRDLICEFPKEGITVLISSHILSEVSLMAEYIAIMSNGVLGYEDKIDKSVNLELLFNEIVRQNRRG